MGIDVWIVNLCGISRENDFAAVADARDGGFHFQRRQILGFVDDDELIRNATAADVCQRFDGYFGAGHHVVRQRSRRHAAVLAADEFKRVIDGLHPWFHLFGEVARKVAEVAADRHGWTEDEQFLIAVVAEDLLEAGGDGEKRFAGSCLARERDEFDSFVQECVKREDLFKIERTDAAADCVSVRYSALRSWLGMKFPS